MLFAELGFYSPAPSKFYADNTTMVDHDGSPIRKFTTKSKHFDVEDKYTVQLVEDRDAELIHKNGRELPCDAMTKALPKAVLDTHYLALHGPPRG